MELALILTITYMSDPTDGKEFLGDRVYTSDGSITKPSSVPGTRVDTLYIKWYKYGLNWIFTTVSFQRHCTAADIFLPFLFI